MLLIMSLHLLLLFLCISGGVFSIEQKDIGRLPKKISNKRAHPSLNVIHGNRTSVDKYPFIASLQLYESQFGAAVVLNRRWLLTSAFTVAWEPIDSIQFRVGSSLYSKRGQVVLASKVILHPNYTGSWDYNIALVKTDRNIRLNKNVKPVKLGTKDLTGGTAAWVAGWGETDSSSTASNILVEAQVTVYNHSDCAKIYLEDLTAQLMCTYDQTVGPCVYDYGDPLVVNGTLYGLFAGGYGCNPGSYPVLYTDIPSLYTWVQDSIKSDEENNYHA